jgi:peptidoglycan/xylan/chitin deacetylase (PgdA/CDA1 family)
MKNLLILTYHAIDNRQSVISTPPKLFRQQMEMLAERNLVGISLAEAFVHLERTGSFPENSIALTFDDGYLSIADKVLPVMQKLDFSGTVFVISGMIGLRADQARAVNSDIDRDMLNWSQIEELARSGFEIGAHTARHPDLTRLSAAALERELGESRQQMQQRLQTPVDSLAYPYGRLNQAVRTAASAHYSRACTTRLGRNNMDLDPLQLRRVDVYFLRNPKVFMKLCDGGLEAYLHFRQYLRDLKQFVS